jgi:hypothetical protein
MGLLAAGDIGELQSRVKKLEKEFLESRNDSLAKIEHDR